MQFHQKFSFSFFIFASCSSCSNVREWKDIVAISAGGWHTVGLKADGTVIAAGYNHDGQCDVSGWKDIVAVSAGACHTVGLKSDGTVIAAGYNHDGQCNVSEFRLFNSLVTIEKERQEKKEALQKQKEEFIAQQRRNAGLCRHCGGEFKGLFTKKCINCGKPKDY